jgi:hypothetical protein
MLSKERTTCNIASITRNTFSASVLRFLFFLITKAAFIVRLPLLKKFKQRTLKKGYGLGKTELFSPAET